MESDDLDEASLRRLRWRARRGMLENDLVITRFLDRHERDLGPTEIRALQVLLALDDNALFDLLIGKSEPQGLEPAAVRMLEMMRDA